MHNERMLLHNMFLLLTDGDARVAVDGLYQLFALMADDPVRINLRGAFRVQRNHLELAEVGLTNVEVLWAHVVDVRHVVLVKVVFASISTAIT